MISVGIESMNVFGGTAYLDVLQLALVLVVVVAPRPPHLDGHADRAVAK